MIDEEYKGWHISHDYDESEGFDKIDRYLIWSPDRLDVAVVVAEFKARAEAKQWIDENEQD